MSPRAKAPPPPCPPLESHWWNFAFRFIGLTGEDGWLSHTKSVVAVVLVWAVAGDHWSEGLVGILIAASGGVGILRAWINKA